MAHVKRAQQRGQTRQRIIETGAELFLRQGYAATTLEQIATQAGVAVQTVYFHFRNKRTILMRAVEILVVGDEEPVPMIERPPARQAMTEPDPRRAIALWVENGRQINERVMPMLRVLRDAAGADPEMAADWEVNQEQRMTDHRRFAERLAELDALRPGMSVETAADVIYGLMAPELYHVLAGERSWTSRQWANWTVEAMTSTLLPAPPVGDVL